jgi:hypothetical protein
LLVTTTIAEGATWSPVETISWSVDYEAAEREMDRAGIEVEAGQVWAFRVVATNKFGDAVASDPVRAIMGSELAPRNPRLQNVRSDDAEHDGRSGLQLTWRSTTNNTVNPLQVITADDTNASDADDTVHNDYAVEYRIEVSEDGVEWKQLVVAEENINATPAGKDTVDEDATLDGNVEPVDTDDADTERNYDSTEQKFTQRQLAASTEKYYRIFAFTRSDTTSDTSPLIMSVPSNERNGSTDEPLHPGRTRNLEALASGRTTIDLTWERPEVTDDGCVVDDTDAAREDDGSECPADSAGSVITGYQIQVSDNGTSGWTNLAVDTCKGDDDAIESPRCMYTHGGLEPDTTKYYRVFAMNVAGDGPLSNTALDTTHLSEFPDVPGGLTGDPYGATAVKLCWLAQSLDPADDPVMSYEITVSGMDDPIMVMATTMGDPVPTQHMITGLNAETKYTFKVRAVNLRGKSNQAATETVTTGMAPSEPPSTELTMPTMVEVMGGVGALTVTWEDGENAVGHLVLLLDSDFDLVMTETAPTGNSHTFSPLAAGQYTAVVVSYKSVSDYEYDHATSTVN